MEITWPSDDPHADAIPFVVTTANSRHSEATASFIRSHVMRGKNRGKTPKKQAKARAPTDDNAAVSVGAVPGPSSSRAPPPAVHALEMAMAMPVPAKIGGEASLSGFSAETGLDILEAVRTLTIALIPFRYTPSFSREDLWWLEALHTDEVVLHFIIFLAKTYQALMRGASQPDKGVLRYHVQTLALLQRRLATGDEAASTSDDTMEVVTGLAKTAAFQGQLFVARKHLEGLRKMVALRGGLEAIDRMLLIRICYADVGLSLSTGVRTVFLPGDTAWDWHIASPWRASTHGLPGLGDEYEEYMSSHFAAFLYSQDIRIRRVYDNLLGLTRAVEFAAHSRVEVDTTAYQETVILTLYRLTNLDLRTHNAGEALRLGLLAFATTLFVQWRGRYEDAAQKLAGALTALEKQPCWMMPQELTLWLYVVGCISFFSEHEQAAVQPAISQLLGVMGIGTWSEAKRALKTVLWIDTLHDRVAEDVLRPVLFPKDVDRAEAFACTSTHVGYVREVQGAWDAGLDELPV